MDQDDFYEAASMILDSAAPASMDQDDFWQLGHAGQSKSKLVGSPKQTLVSKLLTTGLCECKQVYASLSKEADDGKS